MVVKMNVAIPCNESWNRAVNHRDRALRQAVFVGGDEVLHN
jgi:hypothetical protein